jgi:hypothetical protein
MVLPAVIQPGLYPLEIGWYERDNGQRWAVTSEEAQAADRLLLGPLQVVTP